MHTLLIIDDDPATRDSLSELLAIEGREIVTAADGQEALERLMDVPRPCLILLDLAMPRMDGWEFLHHQARDPAIAHIPTIVLAPARRRQASIGETR